MKKYLSSRKFLLTSALDFYQYGRICSSAVRLWLYQTVFTLYWGIMVSLVTRHIVLSCVKDTILRLKSFSVVIMRFASGDNSAGLHRK